MVSEVFTTGEIPPRPDELLLRPTLDFFVAENYIL
jgi:hypothetical protein